MAERGNDPLTRAGAAPLHSGEVPRRFLSRAHERRFALGQRLYGETARGRASGPRSRLGETLFLAPLGAAWSAASALRGRAARMARARLDRPVVSVGGLGIGGSAKTSFVLWLGGRLADLGRSTAVLTRGHGWVEHGDPPLVLLPGAWGDAGCVPDAAHAQQVGCAPDMGSGAGGAATVVQTAGRASVAYVSLGAGPRAVPDEAALMSRAGLPVGAHPRRAAAAAALGRAGVRPEIYLLDDGFQHRQLHRDLDLVLLSARELAASRRAFPVGPFREPWRGLARADAIAMTGLDEEAARELKCADPATLGLPDGPPPILAGPVPAGLVALEDWLAGGGSGRASPWARGNGPGPGVDPAPAGGDPAAFGPWLAFSGIADPPAFEALLARVGLCLSGHVILPDHHRYRPHELARLLSLRPAGGRLVTTEKDAARLPRGWAPPRTCWVARMELRIWRGESALLARVLDLSASPA